MAGAGCDISNINDLRQRIKLKQMLQGFQVDPSSCFKEKEEEYPQKSREGEGKEILFLDFSLTFLSHFSLSLSLSLH